MQVRFASVATAGGKFIQLFDANLRNYQSHSKKYQADCDRFAQAFCREENRFLTALPTDLPKEDLLCLAKESKLTPEGLSHVLHYVDYDIDKATDGFPEFLVPLMEKVRELFESNGLLERS